MEDRQGERNLEPHSILLRGGPVRGDVSDEALAKSELVEGYEPKYEKQSICNIIIFVLAT
jgi:hypothetical protein